MKFATRLNSFGTRPELYWKDLIGKPTAIQLLQRAATVKGLTHVDLNFPNHFTKNTAQEMKTVLADLGLQLNGFAVRYYGDPAFRRGSFTHPDAATRQKAIDIAKKGVDTLVECGGNLMTFWPGQDGFEYPFQCDYGRLWDLQLDGIRQLAEHNKSVTISVEYKPDDPRANSVLNNGGMTLLAVREIGLPNIGMTLDLGHVLYAHEQPAYVATMVNRYSKLVGIHLNDGYAARDDGMMVGSVHLIQTIELLLQMKRAKFDGVYYFDTFPDVIELDPVAETEINISAVTKMMRIVDKLIANPDLQKASEAQDAITTQRIVQAAILGD
ncbi:TIM barrel protein [Rhodoferax sp. 4810]|nr:TIM barrel protein [Rhodoferax jenense]